MFLPEPPRHHVAVNGDAPPDLRRVGEIVLIGLLVADGLHLPHGPHRPVIDAVGQCPEERRLAAHGHFHSAGSGPLDIADGAESRLREAPLRRRAHAPEPPDGERREDLLLPAVRDDGEPVGLVHVARHFREKLIRRDACRSDKAGLLKNFRLDGPADRAQRGILLSHAGDIHEGLIQ